MNKKTVTLITVLLLLCVVIAVVPLATIHDSEFGGADGQAAFGALIIGYGFGYLVARKNFSQKDAR